MRILVTCGPTYEPLDKVRRLTNFSTGKLGLGLANFLLGEGYQVNLLKGYYAVCTEDCRAAVTPFTTTEDLLGKLQAAAQEQHQAIFHAAAVSDFAFGKIHRRLADGTLEPIRSGKLATRDGTLIAELVPTVKIIGRLRALFPSSLIAGWKYEVEGTRESAIALGQKQITENRTNLCVVNGPAYGEGFGIVTESGTSEHCANAKLLYAALAKCITARAPGRS